jgi:hypothetical protein
MIASWMRSIKGQRRATFRPKFWFDIQFKRTLNETAEIVTQYLAKRLVDLRGRRLAPQTVTKLGLNHVEGRFHVRAFVVLLHEPSLIVFVVVIHLPPKGALRFHLFFCPAIALSRRHAPPRCST